MAVATVPSEVTAVAIPAVGGALMNATEPSSLSIGTGDRVPQPINCRSTKVHFCAITVGKGAASPVVMLSAFA